MDLLRLRHLPTLTSTTDRPVHSKTQIKPQTKAQTNNDLRTYRPASFIDLPQEIHLQIVQYLIYPDALSLKHTSRYFWHFVDTGVKLKVEWLMARRSLHLDCPNDTRCDLGSDLRFCRGSVPLLMRRRREHIECESRPGLGCLVYGTTACTQRPKQGLLWRLGRRRLTIEAWWVLLALVSLLLSWLWFVGSSRLFSL